MACIFLAGSLVGRLTGTPEASADANRLTEASKRSDSMSPKYSKSGYDITPLSRERVAALAAKLDPEAYRITQKAGTEPAFCGNLLDNHKDGVYVCVVCGLPLFSSQHKFNSGTGWPSFYQPVRPAAHRQEGGHLAVHGPNRGSLRPLRLPPRPRVRGRPAADRRAPLPELGRAEVLREGRAAAAREPAGKRRRRRGNDRAALGENRGGVLRRRVLLGRRALLQAGPRGDRRAQRLHAGARGPPDLQAGLHRHDRSRRDGQGGVRSEAHHVPAGCWRRSS